MKKNIIQFHGIIEIQILIYQQLLENLISIKAGINKALAAYNLESFKEVRELLDTLSATLLKKSIKNEVVVEF